MVLVGGATELNGIGSVAQVPVPTPVFRIVFSRVALSADRSGGLAGLMALVSVGCLAATVAPRLHLSLPLADGQSCSVGTRIKFFLLCLFFIIFFCLLCWNTEQERAGEITAQVLQNGVLPSTRCVVEISIHTSITSPCGQKPDVIFTFFFFY